MSAAVSRLTSTGDPASSDRETARLPRSGGQPLGGLFTLRPSPKTRSRISSASTRASVSIPPALRPSNTMSFGHLIPGGAGTNLETSSQIVTPIQSVKVCIRSGAILGRNAKLEYRLPFASLCQARQPGAEREARVQVAVRLAVPGPAESA